MSVTFSVGNKKIIDGKTWIINDEKVDQDTLFTFSMERVRSDPSGRISDIIDRKYGGDISYHFYKEESRLKRAGRPYGKTLNEWIKIFSEFSDKIYPYISILFLMYSLNLILIIVILFLIIIRKK